MQWTEGPIMGLSSEKLAELGFPADRLTRHGGSHRRWRRPGQGAGSRQVLELYVALASDETGQRWGCLALWELATFLEDGCTTWRPAAVRPLGDWRDRVQDVDVAAVIAALDPFSPEIPAGCPVWSWTAADVAEYRGLASEQSARRWLSEHSITAQTDPWGVPGRFDGRAVVLQVQAMPGRGKGGGRPPITWSGWSGIGWYAFPPSPPKGADLGLPDPDGRNVRYYWAARDRWMPYQIRQHARSAARLTDGRAHHLADWYPEGWAPYHGRNRALALEILYVIALHDWPDLAPDAAKLAELVAAGDPAPIDAAMADLDRHARLLTNEGLHAASTELADRAQEILREQAQTTERRARDNAARVLAQISRARTPHDDYNGYPVSEGIAMSGALATLDAMLCSSQGGYPPATVVSYRDGDTRVLAEVQRCVWSPAGGPPTHYALKWWRGTRQDGTFKRCDEIIPVGQVTLPKGTTASWLTDQPGNHVTA